MKKIAADRNYGIMKRAFDPYALTAGATEKLNGFLAKEGLNPSELAPEVLSAFKKIWAAKEMISEEWRSCRAGNP